MSGIGAANASAAYPGANGKIAFVSGTPGSYDIYSMDSDGSSRLQLTSTPGDALDADDGADTEIFVMNPDGSNHLQLTDNSDPFRPPGDYLPNWSPDGSKLAFVSERDIVVDPFTSAISPELYTMNADGSGQTRITTNVFLDNEPAWSPDGTSIVLTSDEGDVGGLGEIVRIAADGSGRTNLTQTPAVDDLGPDWQPGL